MHELTKFEKLNKISLPDTYKAFFNKCAISTPDNLVGTDLFNNYPNLKEAAAELLAAGNVEIFLEENDFVFMMHQGYIFWYFKADGTEDPIVYGYEEGNLKPDKLERLSAFLQEYV